MTHAASPVGMCGPKRIGWGWRPAAWEGWATAVLSAIGVMILARTVVH